MHWIDWTIMLGTLLTIVAYGVWKTRNIQNTESYLLGDRDLPWWTIGLSVMATQASAITFLSTPGQAYQDGMGFAQFYFGLPIAMVFLCIFVLPLYYKLKVYTAYEYLEGRFDLRVRTFTAILFLIQRGLAAGITIYAPAIILSKILGWDLTTTILAIGVVVTFYTVMGGTKAVSVTQKQQMIVILFGMFLAAFFLLEKLPEGVEVSDAMGLAGKMGKLEIVDFSFDLSNRYTFWSGMLGGVFLFLSYFGTDQSQVQRYLSGKSLAESRMGLLFNGILKVPMQFLILFVGMLVYVFFMFNQPPLHFNSANVASVENSAYQEDYANLEAESKALFEARRNEAFVLVDALRQKDQSAIDAAQAQMQIFEVQGDSLEARADRLIEAASPGAKVNDKDYVFISFITRHLPVGLIGLLLAVIFSAAMSSTASELSALATTTMVDLYRRSFAPDKSDHHYLNASKWMTIGWGALALVFAMSVTYFDNLIQAVNIIGSLFYGTILGIFMVAFFMKFVNGKAVFLAAIITELLVLLIFYLTEYEVPIRLFGVEFVIKIAYLWLNLIGCVLVMVLAAVFNVGQRRAVG